MSRDGTTSGSENSGLPGVTTSEASKNPQRVDKDSKKDPKRVNEKAAQRFLKEGRLRRAKELENLKAIDHTKVDEQTLKYLIKKKATIHAGHMYGPHAMKISKYAKDKNLIIAVRDLNPATAGRFQEGIKVEDNPPQHLKLHIPQESKDSDGEQHLAIHFPPEAEKFVITRTSTGKDFDIKFKSSIMPELEGFIPVDNKFAKLTDKKANQKMQAMLSDPNSKYIAVPLEKQNSKNETYTLCYYETGMISKKINFCYQGQDGIYYNALENGKPVNVNPKIIKPVEVLIVKATKQLEIPDYDIEAVGRIGKPGHVIQDPELGFILDKDIPVLRDLQKITVVMVKHAFQSLHPEGYDFSMTPKTPYTVFTPDGKISSCKTPKEYLDLLNKWRNPGRNPNDQAYNLIPNPRTGVTVDKNNQLYLPEERDRLDWRELDKEVERIAALAKKNPSNIHQQEQADMAKRITKLKEQYERAKMIIPKIENQEKYENHKKALGERISKLNKEYLEAFGERSPVQKAEDRLRKNKENKENLGNLKKNNFRSELQTQKNFSGKPASFGQRVQTKRESHEEKYP